MGAACAACAGNKQHEQLEQESQDEVDEVVWAVDELLDESAPDFERFRLFVPNSNIIDNAERKIQRVKTLATSSTRCVFLSSFHQTKTLFVLKQFNRDHKVNMAAFEREVRLLAKLKHPNIVPLLTCFVDKFNFYIATKHCSGGSLSDFIDKHGRFNEIQSAYFIKTLLSAVEFIHSQNVVHRDLKAEDIMFDKTPMFYQDTTEYLGNGAKLTIANFNHSIEIENNAAYDKSIGTLYAMPPEIHRVRYGWELKKHDIWSVGVIAYMLLTGEKPFSGETPEDTIHNIGTQKLRYRSGIRISKSCKDFVSRLLTKTPKTRTSAKEALEHCWIVENNERYDKHLEIIHKNETEIEQDRLSSSMSDYGYGHATPLPFVKIGRMQSASYDDSSDVILRGIMGSSEIINVDYDELQDVLDEVNRINSMD